MKRAIAMKCNQKQWDGIKGKLVGLELCNITDFNYSNYLTNNYNWGFDYKGLANHRLDHSNSVKCELHQTWNEQVFLEACGIETEKTFKGSELQYKHFRGLNWIDLDDDGKEYRLKPDYSKEIAELERQIQILKNK